MKIEAQVTIQANIEDVFRAFSNLESLEQRIQGIEKIEILNPPAHMQVGTKWRETRIMFGKEATEEMWVTELTPNKNYVVEAESHGTHYRSEYTFTDADDGVVVNLTFEGKPLNVKAKVLGVMFSIFAKSMKKLLEKDMNDLRMHLERKD